MIVKEGVAHLWGVIEPEEEQRAICVAAESVLGVKEVRSRLEFPMVSPSMLERLDYATGQEKAMERSEYRIIFSTIAVFFSIAGMGGCVHVCAHQLTA